MTPDELAEHMRKVRAGEVRILSEQERAEHIFLRWGPTLAALAEAERGESQVTAKDIPRVGQRAREAAMTAPLRLAAHREKT